MKCDTVLHPKVLSLLHRDKKASQHPEHEDDGHMKCDTVLHPKVLSPLPRGTSLTGTLVQ
jgi:hypothetical protein